MKKFLFAAGGIILSFNIFAAVTDPGAVVYVNPAFGGASRYVATYTGFAGDNDLAGTQFQDSIKSAIVGPRTCLMLHMDSQFTGSTLFLTEGTHTDLSIYGFSNLISSLQAFEMYAGETCTEEGVAHLYTDANQKGRRALVAPRHGSTTNVNGSIGNMNDQISSLYVPPGYCLTVSNDNTVTDFHPGTTRSTRFGPGYWGTLSSYGWNDVISEYRLDAYTSNCSPTN